MKRKVWSFVLVLVLLLFLGYISANIFGPKLQFWEESVLLVRKYESSGTSLSAYLSILYQAHSILGKIVTFLDKTIAIFPTWVGLHWWDGSVVYDLVSLPIIIALVIFLVLGGKSKIRLLGFILTIFWLIPIPTIMRNFTDNLIIKTRFDWKLPNSSTLVWIWRHGENTINQPFTFFRYHWNQKHIPNRAEILISCLGEYQLIVNNKSTYHGLNWAVPPKVFYDTISLDESLSLGSNEIQIICSYASEKHHQYVTFPEPGLVLGGGIPDGLITHNLADGRLWEAAPNENWGVGQRISTDTGYSEKIDLSSDRKLNWQVPRKLDIKSYILTNRPLPLLVEKAQQVHEIVTGLYDLGRTSNGYLSLNGDLKTDCTVKITWSDKLLSKKSVQSNGQEDAITFPKGKVNWEQFSRRAGRYLDINKSDCQDLIVGFKSVGFPFIEPDNTFLKQDLDRKIFDLAVNTLKNNIQDHYEDSIVREKAMYLGDARETSRCLMSDGQNTNYVKQMIRLFADSQNQDGSFPAMAPSGNPVIIYDYILQWVVWVKDYLVKTNDIALAREVLPTVDKVMSLFENDENQDGFINQKWWVFIDWTGVDRSLPSLTSLQIWYYQALRSAAIIENIAGKPNDKNSHKADQLKTKLLKHSFDNKSGLFVDSFSSTDQSSRKSLITNALAGISDLFTLEQSKIAIAQLKSSLFTQTPFSQSWVVEWLIKSKEKDMALDVIRQYWGGMIKDGATAVYESYSLSSGGDPTSYSHAWGCGPIYLYKEIFSK